MSEFIKDKLKLIFVSVVLAACAYFIMTSLNMLLGDKILWLLTIIVVYWVGWRLVRLWKMYKSKQS